MSGPTKARGLMFSAPMVRALLEGRKTQTRRVLKPQPFPAENAFPPVPGALPGDWVWPIPRGAVVSNKPHAPPQVMERLPYRVGDVLYVRETWNNDPVWWGPPVSLTYRADYVDVPGDYSLQVFEQHGLKWRPAIHMPREHSRLTLTLTDVRVQRLQDITDADAIAEGFPGRLGPNPDYPDEWDPTPVEEFRQTIDSLNAKRGFGWKDNPWMVALTFAMERRNVDG